MSRILAIDYGKKRTGIAVTDILQMIANGLTTVATTELMDFVLKYVEKEPVERIIVGHPKQMNNEDSENMKRIIPFVNQLKKKLPNISPVKFVVLLGKILTLNQFTTLAKFTILLKVVLLIKKEDFLL
jgi:putative Holliday junction resolvase